MKIPPETLSAATLQEVVEEFVTRDGTDSSGERQRVADVLAQLADGIVELHFDAETGSCNIVNAAG